MICDRKTGKPVQVGDSFMRGRKRYEVLAIEPRVVRVRSLNRNDSWEYTNLSPASLGLKWVD